MFFGLAFYKFYLYNITIVWGSVFMNQKEILGIKEDLGNFLLKIKDVREEDYDEKAKNSLYLEYKELYSLYLNIPTDEIAKNFTTSDVKVINLLKLGMKNEQDFNQLIEKIGSNLSDTAISVASFIKSRQGFELINTDSDFSKYSDDELVTLFGSIFGIQMAGDCVRSLRAEKVGRVVGYALSGLCEQHFVEYADLQKKDKNAPPLVDFLKNKIQESDVEGSYVFNEKPDGLDVSCLINDKKHASITDVRGRNRVDHCFVNHKTKAIVFGQSTSNKDTEGQGYSFYKGYVAFKNLVEREMVNGSPNPYFGYRLEPYYFLGGRFVADGADVKQQKGRDFLKMISGASLKEKEELAQLQYFSLFANAVGQEMVNVLPKYNVFIAGCNTEPIYMWQQMALGKCNNEHEMNREVFGKTVECLNNVSKTLNKSEISLTEWGKHDLNRNLVDIVNIGNGMFINFNKEISMSEYNEKIKPLHRSLTELVEKIKPNASYFGNSVVNDLNRFAKSIRSVEIFNENMAEAILPEVSKVNWIEPPVLEKKVVKKDELGVLSGIADYLSTQVNLGSAFLENYSNILSDVFISGYSPQEAKDGYYSTRESFNASSLQARKKLRMAGHGVVADFIDKSLFLLKKDEYVMESRYEKQLSKLMDFVDNDLSPIYPEVAKAARSFFKYEEKKSRKSGHS